jgi:hypothetical protein
VASAIAQGLWTLAKQQYPQLKAPALSRGLSRANLREGIFDAAEECRLIEALIQKYMASPGP